MSSGSAGPQLGEAAPIGTIAFTRTLADRPSWITVADLAGGARRQITSPPPKDGPSNDYDPVWSPDGSRLAFVRATARLNKDPVASLFVVNADGTGLQRVAQLGPIPESEYVGRDRPSWSPDGRQLAYGNGPLYVVSSDGTNIRKLAAKSTCSPSWSPDGKSILYFVDDYPCAWARGNNASEPGYRSIYRIDADGRNRRLLASGSFGDAAWSPDGRQIAYAANCAVQHGGDWFCSIYLMDADGKKKRRLVENSFGGWVEWAAGGQAVLWSLGSPTVTYVATRSRRKLLPGTSPGDLVGISKDGRTIAIFTWLDVRIVLVTVNGQVLQRPRVPSGWKFDDISVYLG